MAEIRRLNPHDPLPEGKRQLSVMQRFDEDDPRRTVVEIILAHGRGPDEVTRPARDDGGPMSFEQALVAAQAVARDEGITVIHAIDRTAGPRERDIAQHGGDHSVNMDELQDMDLEEGERGPDMLDRDVARRSRQV